MGKNSCSVENGIIPLAFNDIQVNFCKNPKCENFGLTPEDMLSSEEYLEAKSFADSKRVRVRKPFYKIQKSSPRHVSLSCKGCHKLKSETNEHQQTFHILKSNKAVFEELERITRYMVKPNERCPNEECLSNIGSTPTSIKKRGFTAAGRQRYYCNVCQNSFTNKPARHRNQRKSKDNKTLLRYLMQGNSIRSLAEGSEVSPQTVYNKIDFFHEQCMAFAAERESKLNSMAIERLYLSTDRQVQISNWTNRKHKKNCEFYGIATADRESSYVFAFNFNYDPDLNPLHINQLAQESGDSSRENHLKTYARVWLESEFNEDTPKKEINGEALLASGSLEGSIENKINFDNQLNSTSSSERFDSTTQLPLKGMEVHNEYTMMAHFFFLKRLFKNVGKTRFYMDQDSGMKTAYIAAFKDEIINGTSDGYLVNTEKGLTRDQKEIIYNLHTELIEEVTGKHYPRLSKIEKDKAIQLLTEVNLRTPFVPNRSSDKWVTIPEPSMAEPKKMVCAVTNQSKYTEVHQARLLMKGTLHPVDRFFMQIRRRVSMFERPFLSGTNSRRTWYANSPYNPEMYQKLADIYRVYYNYCKPFKNSNKKETPATRLGLAKGVVQLEKILYYDRY